MHDFAPVMPPMNKLKSCVKLVKKCIKSKEATERVEVNSRSYTMIAHYSGNERKCRILSELL